MTTRILALLFVLCAPALAAAQSLTPFQRVSFTDAASVESSYSVLFTTLFQDNFTSAGENIEDHVMDVGAGWTESGGNCYADVTGVGYCDAPAGLVNAVTEAGTSDGTYTGVFNIPAADDYNMWLSGRFTDASNWFQLNITRSGGGNTMIAIYDVTATTYCAGPDSLGSVAPGAAPVTATFSGSTITFTVDGSGVVENCLSSNNVTATKFGFGNYSVTPNAVGTYDSLLFDGTVGGGGGGGTTKRLLLLGVGGDEWLRR